MRDITAIGEILIDLTQTGKNQQQVPVFAANPGGAPANVAVAAARLGCRTAFIGKVGNDGFGAYLRGVLEENGVDHAGLQVGESPTTMAIVSVDERGERSFRFIRGADCESAAGYSPYESFATDGGIRQVWLRGRLAVENGNVLFSQPEGQYMARGKCML